MCRDCLSPQPHRRNESTQLPDVNSINDFHSPHVTDDGCISLCRHCIRFHCKKAFHYGWVLLFTLSIMVLFDSVLFPHRNTYLNSYGVVRRMIGLSYNHRFVIHQYRLGDRQALPLAFTLLLICHILISVLIVHIFECVWLRIVKCCTGYELESTPINDVNDAYDSANVITIATDDIDTAAMDEIAVAKQKQKRHNSSGNAAVIFVKPQKTSTICHRQSTEAGRRLSRRRRHNNSNNSNGSGDGTHMHSSSDDNDDDNSRDMDSDDSSSHSMGAHINSSNSDDDNDDNVTIKSNLMRNASSMRRNRRNSQSIAALDDSHTCEMSVTYDAEKQLMIHENTLERRNTIGALDFVRD